MSWNCLHLNRFKAFASLSLPLAPLTILTGFNAAGKSTCLQSLAVLHQTTRENEWSNSLLLNGRSINLGTSVDVINRNEGGREFSLGLREQDQQIRWHFSNEHSKSVFAEVKHIELEDMGQTFHWDHKEPLRRLIPQSIYENRKHTKLFTDRVYEMVYLTAERIGPRETYAISSPHQKHDVGTQGEFTAWYLHEFGDQEVYPSLRAQNETPQLKRQAPALLGHFFPGASFELKEVESANLITLSFRTSTGGELYRPQNVGYGLTHTLPIIAATLGARAGRVIAIENPEAHLHPAGQALMGAYLAKVAALGIQIIIETHSDHILNGVRRAVKQSQLAADAVAIHFFSKSSLRNDKSEVISVAMDQSGALDHWPEGFFDQFDKDNAYFAGW